MIQRRRHFGTSSRTSTGKYRPGHVALERAFSKLGLASRALARQWILAGRVKVNGRLTHDPLLSVHPEQLNAELDGVRLSTTAIQDLFVFYKPKNWVCTHHDEKGRPTVFDFLKEKHPKIKLLGLHSVGRLDQATTGLLLLTHSPKISAWLTDPSNEVERVYQVTVRGEVIPQELQEMERGIEAEIEGKFALLQVHQAKLLKASGRESGLILTLKQGKNREIRRICEALGHEVTRLKRVRYGSLTLEGLEPGGLRQLSPEEIRTHFPDLFSDSNWD
jgi:23S rRNA pseudouridine2605 synthase